MDQQKYFEIKQEDYLEKGTRLLSITQDVSVKKFRKVAEVQCLVCSGVYTVKDSFKRDRANTILKCPHCFDNKLKTEAENCNLVLLGPAKEEHVSNPANYRSYKLPCGCVQDIQTTHVRRSNYSCTTCNRQRFEDSLQLSGLVDITNADTPLHYATVIRIDCSHVQNIPRTKILTNNVSFCWECFEDNLKEKCKETGLLYKSRESNRGGSYRTFTYTSCGHDKEVIPCQAINGNHECQVCLGERYTEDAINNDLVYLPDEPFIGNKRKYRMPCGHEKYFRHEHVRLGRWACDICEENQYTKPSGVYLLHITEDDFSWLKLGYSAKLDNRISVYGLSKEANVEVISYKNVENGLIALHKEKEIHNKYKKQRLNKHLMKKYHKYNGGSECYPVELKEDLIIEIENI